MLKAKDIHVVVYHAHCIDGLTSAAIAYDFAAETQLNYEYIPMRAGEIPDALLVMKNKNILFVDVSPKKSEYEIMEKNECRILILDHHITAKDELKTIDDNHKIFNMKFSGASLAHAYFNGNPKKDLFVSYVQDKDLNTKMFGKETDYLFQALCEELNPIKDSNTKIPLMSKNFNRLDELLKLGEVLFEQNQLYIEKVFLSGKEKAIKQNIFSWKKHKVFVMHTDSVKLCGEIGMYVLSKLPHIEYTMVIYPGVNKKGESIHLFSLRSREGFDVSEIAKQYGGGGHKQAAGFECKNLQDVFKMTFLPELSMVFTAVLVCTFCYLKGNHLI